MEQARRRAAASAPMKMAMACAISAASRVGAALATATPFNCTTMLRMALTMVSRPNSRSALGRKLALHNMGLAAARAPR